MLVSNKHPRLFMGDSRTLALDIDPADIATRHALCCHLSHLYNLIDNWSKSMGDLFAGSDWFATSFRRLEALPRLPAQFYGPNLGGHARRDASESGSSDSDGDIQGLDQDKEELIAMEDSEDEDIVMHGLGLL
jgi:hypothetical protein